MNQQEIWVTLGMIALVCVIWVGLILWRFFEDVSTIAARSAGIAHSLERIAQVKEMEP